MDELPVIALDEPTVTDRNCTRQCLIDFDDTMSNHCMNLPQPIDEAKCFFKASATLAECLDKCLAPNETGLIFKWPKRDKTLKFIS